MPLYLRTFFQNCSVVFAPTEGMGQYLTQECRLDPEKVGILPTGIENRNFQTKEEEAAAVRRKYGAENMPLLLTVSRMTQEKNVTFLLESLARAKALYGKPFRMLMVGWGQDLEAQPQCPAGPGGGSGLYRSAAQRGDGALF